MNQNSRALKTLDRLQAATGLSAEGRSAFIQLANPFSDFEFVKAGYPDSIESSSIVQQIKRSAVISAPASVVSGTWDCHICSLPFLGSVPIVGNGVLNVGYGMIAQLDTVTPNMNCGPITVMRGVSGSNLGITTFGGIVADGGTFGLELASAQDASSASFIDGTSRLIGIGFEIHNTTSQLNKQGSLCVYRQPQTQQLDRQSRSPMLVNNLTNPTVIALGSAISTLTYSDVPSTLAQALLLAGSQQWEAADGAMIIPTLSGDDLPPTRREAIVPVLLNEVTQFITIPTNVLPGTVTLPLNRAASQPVSFVLGLGTGNVPERSSYSLARNKFCNFNTSGCFLTGLSVQTTLTINVVYYVERFPAAQELDLVVMANPSPKYDPVFWPLYSACMREMPVGVKVGDNADGDWFYNLVSGAAKFLGPSLAVLGGPVGIAGGALATAAGSWAESRLAANVAERVAKTAAKNAITNSSKAMGATWTETSGMRNKGGRLTDTSLIVRRAPVNQPRKVANPQKKKPTKR